MARPTLKEIARIAGVSVSTVSLALSAKGKISASQSERIRKIADEIGYSPNPLLASLASKRFRTGDTALGNLIAILCYPYSSQNPSARSLYAEDLMRTARELGYSPQFFDARSMEAYVDLPETLYRRGTLGVIITGQADPGMFAEPSRWRSFSLVQCGRFQSPLPIDTIRSDIFTAIKMAYTKLRALGYRRIGFGFGRHPTVLEDDEARFGAANAMQSLHAAPEDRIPIYEGTFGDLESFTKWALTYRPEVVIAFTMAQWWALKDAGLRVPEDIGFVSLHLHMKDNQIAADSLNTAGLFQRTDHISRQSIFWLDQLIRHNQRGFPAIPQQNLISPEWHFAASLIQK